MLVQQRGDMRGRSVVAIHGEDARWQGELPHGLPAPFSAKGVMWLHTDAQVMALRWTPPRWHARLLRA